MNYYQLRDCSGTLPDFWTMDDLSGLSVGDFIQSAERPGVCLEIITIQDTDPLAVLETVTPAGPTFTSCTECYAGTLSGCTNPRACNYNPCATIDDGSCTFNDITIRVLCPEEKLINNCNNN